MWIESESGEINELIKDYSEDDLLIAEINNKKNGKIIMKNQENKNFSITPTLDDTTDSIIPTSVMTPTPNP